ncbi:MAG: OmpA family protein [Acidobacteria bacterium]|nr:OmpA family protein [Acidobacteriota bacterium]
MPVVRNLSLFLALALSLLFAGCGKKKAPIMPPAPIAPTPSDTSRTAPSPTATLEIEPARILKGEKAILRWSSTGATSARISPGVGSVETSGRLEVSPVVDTVFRLDVAGVGGDASATAKLAVLPARDEGIGGRRPGVTSEDLMPRMEDRLSEIRDVYFGYDQSDLGSDAQNTLIQNATLLKMLFADYPNGRVLIEGHCDERGSNEYNLALGDRRAAIARDFLVEQGVPAQNLQTVSYGEEKPQCFEAAESCWSLNRRAHFTPAP